MTDLETLQKGIGLLTNIKQVSLEDRRQSYGSSTSIPDEVKDDLVSFQRISIRIERILSQVGVKTIVQAHGRTFDVLQQSASDGDLMMINLTLPILNQAEGFLSDPGHISEAFTLNTGIDADVNHRFMTGDYSGAVAKALKIFKSKIHAATGTDEIDKAIGLLKQRWEHTKEMSGDNRINFEKGVTHLFNCLSRFRNVEFHSEDWLIDDKQEAFYFITIISMALDILDKYLVAEVKN